MKSLLTYNSICQIFLKHTRQIVHRPQNAVLLSLYHASVCACTVRYMECVCVSPLQQLLARILICGFEKQTNFVLTYLDGWPLQSLQTCAQHNLLDILLSNYSSALEHWLLIAANTKCTNNNVLNTFMRSNFWHLFAIVHAGGMANWRKSAQLLEQLDYKGK